MSTEVYLSQLKMDPEALNMDWPHLFILSVGPV